MSINKFIIENSDHKVNVIFAGEKGKNAKLISQFYKYNPFPIYNDFETKTDLKEHILSKVFLIDLKKYFIKVRLK